MGKRRVVIVSSSDDEDGDHSGRVTQISKLRTSSSREKYKGSKMLGANSRSSKRTRNVEEVNFTKLFEDFSDDLCGFNAIPAERKRRYNQGSGWMGATELWVEKYKPCSSSELAVHRKKIEEVKLWLEQRISTSKAVFHNYVLVVTGPTGVGKSATIHTIASELGAELCEWRTPTPTLWQEHLHSMNSVLQYTSKLDEFETFVERVRKYALLPSSSTSVSKKPVVILIDDLPVTHGRVSYGRLSKCLHFLVQSTQIPTFILITEYHKVDSGDGVNYLEELQSSLERAGASKVAFNPITLNSIKKCLSRICREEKCNISNECIDQIAKSSVGDIRHAIMSLQYFCLRPDLVISMPLSVVSITSSKPKVDIIHQLRSPNVNGGPVLDDGFLLPFGRDETLSLFHALGKFLHNKRDTVHAVGPGQDPFLLQARFTRFPLKMDEPEKVISQAYGQARPITDFLHENVLDFLSDEAIEDASIITSYLSGVDCLLKVARHGHISLPGRDDQLENVGQLVAASVAVRGVLFGNSHPSPSRWHSIRSPKLWQVEQSSRRNKKDMVSERYEADNSFSSSSLLVLATEYKPALKWLRFRVSSNVPVHKKPPSSRKAADSDSDPMDPDESKAGSSEESEEDDEIEDW